AIAAAVFCDRHAEPDVAGGHVCAAGIATRSFFDAAVAGLSRPRRRTPSAQGRSRCASIAEAAAVSERRAIAEIAACGRSDSHQRCAAGLRTETDCLHAFEAGLRLWFITARRAGIAAQREGLGAAEWSRPCRAGGCADGVAVGGGTPPARA